MSELSNPATGGIAKEVESQCVTVAEPVVKESRPRSPWISGLFYLLVGVVTCAQVLIIAAHVPWYAVPMIVLATLLFSAVIGALQLRHDERLTEETFLRIVVRSMRLRSFQSERQQDPGEDD